MVKSAVRSIVGAIDDTARRWGDRDFRPRVRAAEAVRLRTGYSLPVVEHAFDTLFSSLRRDAIEAVIRDELGSLSVLDGFSRRAGRAPARALPLGSVCVISSRTTIGVALVPAVFALCAGCRVVVKDREDRLAAAFFETLIANAPELGAEVETHTWNGKSDAGKLEDFEVIVAFGDDSTLAEISARLHFPTRLIAYGSKASAGYVTREALETEPHARDLASRAARDIVLYDGEGCLSLRALFVERGAPVSPDTFGDMVADAVRLAEARFPRSMHDPRVAADAAMARDIAAFRGARAGSDAESSFLVVVDAPADEPPLFLPRAIAIRSVEGPDHAVAYLKRHRIGLEALAVERRRPDLAGSAAEMGASRITTFGALQRPPLGTFHGGRPRIAEFVRWIVDET